MSAKDRLAALSNLRVCWQAPGAPADFRSGSGPAGAVHVIEAYAEAKGRSDRDVPGFLREGVLRLEGIITRWALLPEGAGWLDAGTAWAWQTDGLRPDGLLPGAQGRAYWGLLSELPALGDGELGEVTFSELGGAFGAGGAGALVRSKLGDQFVAGFGSPV